MPNPENLKNFEKGFDPRRNLNGAPKKLPELDAILIKIANEEKGGITAMEALFKTHLVKAIKGDIRSAEFIVNRAYGKLKEIIVTNPDTPEQTLEAEGFEDTN